MKKKAWLAFELDRSSKTPIFEQLCEAIRQKAAAGDLAEGFRLPPTRAFAIELGVSRSTIITAYDQLVAEGYLQSKPGSGYTLCVAGGPETVKGPAFRPNWPAQESITPPEPFDASHPDMELFPHRQWANAVARICRTEARAMLAGSSLFGNFELRKAIADHISDWRGIEASPHQIMITSGSTEGLEICFKSLCEIGSKIGLENPGYWPLRTTAKTLGLKPINLSIGEGGTVLPKKGSSPRLVVLTPSHQYPLGGAMSPNRREEFSRWAKAHNSWIIEDDYDSEFRYAGRPIPAMAGFDRLDRTVYVGSFSKIFSNSLRLGYIVVPEHLCEHFGTTLQKFGPKASSMPQLALARFMQSGEFYRHLRRVRRIYGERRKFLLNRLTKDFSEFGSFTDYQAGMQVVLNLEPNLKDTEIAEAASKAGLRILALSDCADGKSDYNGLVLGYCGFSIECLDASLKKLQNIFLSAQRAQGV